MANIHDIEYGPNPPDAAHEHSDIDPGVGYKFGAWLAVAMLMSAAIVYGTFWFFDGRATTADEAALKYPLAAGRQEETRPLPHLQNQPFKDIYKLRQAEDERLGSYAWVDQETGVTRIPIERAMEVLLEKGLPARTGGADGLKVVVSDASSGRTIHTR